MRPWLKPVVAALVAWHVADSLSVRPDYLAYFGPQAGGSEGGYRHLVDSSLDWGMDLPELKRWLDARDPEGRERVFLAYFGTDSPSYHGIKAQRLPGFFDRRKREPYALEPGYYAISATLFQGLYVAAFARWNETYERIYRAKLNSVVTLQKAMATPDGQAALFAQKPEAFWNNEFQVYDHFRFGRLCAWLRQQGEPPHHVGHSIFIWKLDYAALEAALLGPPVEMGVTPPEWRRLLEVRE